MAGRVWRLTMLTPWTRTRLSFGRTRRTSPVLPLSLPAMTTTLSPFLIFSLTISIDPGSQHFGRERDDLHELAGAQLARHRSEDARADRLALLVDEHRRVAVEADGAAVGAANLLRRAHDHRLMDVALLDAAARDRLLDRDDDDVADRRRLALGAAQHLDALDAARAGIVGDIEIGLHLDHDAFTPRPWRGTRPFSSPAARAAWSPAGRPWPSPCAPAAPPRPAALARRRRTASPSACAARSGGSPRCGSRRPP